MTRRPRIYVAGPLEGSGDLASNVRSATKTAAALLEGGCEAFCPHWGLIVALVETSSISRDRWLEWGISWVGVCDAVLRLPGVSPGSDAEVAEAHRLGLPVFTSVADVRAWASPGGYRPTSLRPTWWPPPGRPARPDPPELELFGGWLGEFPEASRRDGLRGRLLRIAERLRLRRRRGKLKQVEKEIP